jgi:hypothetical protein
MDKQDKKLKEETPDTEEQPVQQEDQLERLKETTEKIWGSTRHAFSTATFKANQYKKLVQIKIDQSSLHKKINAAHTDLGKMIDDLREAGKKSIMNLSEVKEILERIDELKAASAALEEEVEQIKTEDPPKEKAQGEAQEEETK